MISLSIDGKTTEVAEGTTVLEAATALGIYIPTLCYHEELKPNSACRLCTVEVTQGTRSWLTASCSLPAAEGMEVQTASERVLVGRRILMELLAARCSENEPILEMAKEVGAKTDRLEAKKDDCILCGLCVGVCNDVMGAGAIGFSGRGVEREVAKPFGEVLECQACGACSFVCPTGAMKMEKETIERQEGKGEPRHCRYMRMGMIPYGLCPSALECHRCEVDQRMEDTLGTHAAFVARPAKQKDPVDVGSFAVMPDRYYHDGHVWAEAIGGHVRLGVDDFARTLIGPVEDLRLLKDSGSDIAAGEGLCELTLSNNRTVTVVSPVSGTISSLNEDVVLDPTLLWKAPYTRGWICLVLPSALEEDLAALRFKDPLVPHYLRGAPDPVCEWVKDEADKLGGMLANQGPDVYAEGQLQKSLPEVISEAEWQTMTQAFFGTP